jgi:hypothetical protein
LEEPNDIQRRIFQIIEVQHKIEILNEKRESHQIKVKEVFDKKTKKHDFKT